MSDNSERINSSLDFQPYNSNRPDMPIPEYGRNIQKMVEYAGTIEDREQRNLCVRAIISVMGQLFPYLRDTEDYNHKLWDHLQIMSKFSLDVDSPYPKPTAEQIESKPDRIPYPQGDVAIGHYGRYVQKFIAKCAEMEEGPEREAFSLAIATTMKQNALNWNRNTVTDDVILKDLGVLSKNKVKVEPTAELYAVKTIVVNKFQDFDTGFTGKKKNKNKKIKRKFGRN
jgi:hypothetical protein